MTEGIKKAAEKIAMTIVSALGLGAAGVNYVYVFLISMLPIIELRGAIPAAFALGLDPVRSYIAAVAGNLIPVPFILLLITRLCKYLKNTRVFSWFPEFLEKKVEKNRDKVTKYENLGLFLFVAIPIPGTGAWTGALIASFLEFRFRDAFISIICGVLTAGVIMYVFSYGLLGLIF